MLTGRRRIIRTFQKSRGMIGRFTVDLGRLSERRAECARRNEHAANQQSDANSHQYPSAPTLKPATHQSDQNRGPQAEPLVLVVFSIPCPPEFPGTCKPWRPDARASPVDPAVLRQWHRTNQQPGPL